MRGRLALGSANLTMADEGIHKVTERLLGSVLISAKDGVPLHRLAKEYREVGFSQFELPDD